MRKKLIVSFSIFLIVSLLSVVIVGAVNNKESNKHFQYVIKDKYATKQEVQDEFKKFMIQSKEYMGNKNDPKTRYDELNVINEKKQKLLDIIATFPTDEIPVDKIAILKSKFDVTLFMEDSNKAYTKEDLKNPDYKVIYDIREKKVVFMKKIRADYENELITVDEALKRFDTVKDIK